MRTSKLLRLMPILVLTLLTFALFSNGNAYTDNIGINTPSYSQVTDRQGWKHLNNAVKLSTYKTFTHEKKQEFWKLKYEELRKLHWNSQEREHISSLYEIICNHPELMERGSGLQEQEDEFEVFLYNWNEDARNYLGWTYKLIFAISASGDEVLNIEGDLKSNGVAWNINNSTRFITDCRMCEKIRDPKVPEQIPYPGNCRAYFTCIMGTAFPHLCPEGLRFDSSTKSCKWPNDVDCPDDPFYRP